MIILKNKNKNDSFYHFFTSFFIFLFISLGRKLLDLITYYLSTGSIASDIRLHFILTRMSGRWRCWRSLWDSSPSRCTLSHPWRRCLTRVSSAKDTIDPQYTFKRRKIYTYTYTHATITSDDVACGKREEEGERRRRNLGNNYCNTPIMMQLPHDSQSSVVSPSFGEGDYLIKSILSTLCDESNNVSSPRYRAYQSRVCFHVVRS